ncbi:conserved exported hypothetical protein [Bradyrhizobium sp. STM 3843]|uniref:hypothetical protein n=1 Tax=Bradyrhizobium sp. STM 3843 TaxID=551947 RepID=UPI000240AF0A|nr:hypothetical protein [Bradyrhizobium sp. STM 3843]CCE05685.1 conserved exported hypothetical protein [Bradyrhizobium sp. STM 3843]
MLRVALVVFIASWWSVPASAQAPSTQAPSAQVSSSQATSAAPAKTAAKKSASKAKSGAKPAAAVQSGPCTLGVISVVEDRFEVDKFGVTIFETEVNEVPIAGWGLDDLVVARVRAAMRGDPNVRRINYPKGAFEPYYNPKSRFLPDPHESLPAIVRDVTANANCERYLVVTKFKGVIPGTRLVLNGIGTYNQGLGRLIRHSHLFANIAISLIDGKSYERITSFAADTGARLAESMRITEDPLKKLDNADFPDPPSAASNSPLLRERIRTLVADKLDRDLPKYLETH